MLKISHNEDFCLETSQSEDFFVKNFPKWGLLLKFPIMRTFSQIEDFFSQIEDFCIGISQSEDFYVKNFPYWGLLHKKFHNYFFVKIMIYF